MSAAGQKIGGAFRAIKEGFDPVNAEELRAQETGKAKVEIYTDVSIEFLEALAKAAVNATHAMDGLTYAMKRQDRLQPQWSLLAMAFGLGGLVTFLLLSVR